jgi:DNA-binding HxlR family transcriptional regulator
MALGQPVERLEPPPRIDTASPGHEMAELLRLFGAGAAGSILLALGDGPLRTKELAARVSGFAPRTVYRYAGKLAEIGAVKREEEPGVPSKVIYSLTDPCGRDLHELIDAFAKVSLEVLPDGEIVPGSWGSLKLLADLWESGMFQELNGGPRTATELARAGHDWSFHQVSRRTSLFLANGLIRETGDGGRRRRYELTEKARRETAVIAALGRWRQRYVVPAGEPGVTAFEMAELLRAALPLVVLPEYASKTFELAIPPEAAGGEAVWGEVEPDGTATCVDPMTQVDGWGRGEVEAWIEMLMDGASKGIRFGGGDRLFVRDCVQGIHPTLWKDSQRQG